MTNNKNIERFCDKYFTRSRKVAEAFGDVEVTYAVFLRHDSRAAIKLAVDLIKEHCPEASFNFKFKDKSGNIVENVEGNFVPAKKKVMEITGPYSKLSELETLFLQRLGMASVAAHNAYVMSKMLPDIQFMDMSARHMAGAEMHNTLAYGCSVGSKAAQAEGAKGFIGSSTDETAHFYGAKEGMGTIPHALVGYAQHTINEGKYEHEFSGNATLRSVQMFVKANPETPFVAALVDFNGREVTDSLITAEWFYNEAKLQDEGKFLGVRLDTHGGRFLEGLNWDKSIEVMESHLGIGGEYEIVKRAIGEVAFNIDSSDIIVDQVRKTLFGPGVSAASIIHMRKSLNNEMFRGVKIIASSGFDVKKCTIMKAVSAPIDLVGTGSFMPKTFSETYATADVVRYSDEYIVKTGREYLYEENIRRGSHR